MDQLEFVKEPWFLNKYYCKECDIEWHDEWSCMCNDRCPNCSDETEPYESEEITDEGITQNL